MKTYQLLQVVALSSVMAMGPVAVAGSGSGKASVKGAEVQNIAPVSVTLSIEEAAMLTFMREEEKLARDVYRILFDQWSKRVFANISDSEQRHMDSLAGRLGDYQLPDPIVDNSTGAFVNTDLATAYLDLTEWGMTSLEDALRVGAYIEELDILDIQHAMAESTHADLDAVYEELIRGSRNHLRAFVGQIESRGIVYEAQLMAQQDVDEIVNSPLERG